VRQNQTASVGFLGLEEIIIKEGSSKQIRIEIINDGEKFLNDCSLVFGGKGGEWLSGSDARGLSPGERSEYEVELEVPDIEPGSYSAEVDIVCEEIEGEGKFNILVYRNNFEIEILEYERDGNKLVVLYLLTEYSGEAHEIVIDFSMLDLDGIARLKDSLSLSLGARETGERTLEIDLPKDSFGEFTFEMVLNDGVTEISATKDIFLPSSQRGLTGLAISDEIGERLSIIGAIIVVLVGAVLIYWFIRKHRKKVSKMGVKSKKKLIELEL